MTRKLYSLCGADSAKRFSPHVFKAAMALAHKGLDFEEVPTAFTAIPAIENGFSPTVPVLNDQGKLVRDSYDIALYLEDAYPDRPSLFDGIGGQSVTRAIEGYTLTILQPAMMKIIILDIYNSLAPVDQDYYRSSREKRFGKSLEAVTEGAAAELAALPAKFEPVRHALKSAPFLGGQHPLFADYIVFGALAWADVISDTRMLAADDPVSDWYARCMDLHGGAPRSWMAA